MNKEVIVEKINYFLVDEFEVETEDIEPRANLKETLELDSLDFVDLVVAIEKRPEKASNYYNRANAYRLQSKLDLARLDYLKVVELSPQSSLSKLAKIRIKEIPETLVPKKEKSSKWNWFQKSQE